MTRILVDTSALVAALNVGDEHHGRAVMAWTRLLEGIKSREYSGVTHYGVVMEANALVQRRLGMDAVRELHDGLLAALDLEWVDRTLHRAAVSAMLAAGHRRVSLVDWTSFELMRAKRIRYALAFDSDFERRGFRLPW